MNEIVQAVLLAFAAGVTIPLGGFLAKVERIQPDWLDKEFRHFLLAFGGGALLAAVALVLVPHGMSHHAPLPAALLFSGGGVAMMLVDSKLQRSGAPASNLVAMLSDYLPEAIALGAAISADAKGAALLAALIGMQNLPEGFNAYRELKGSGRLPAPMIPLLFWAASILGPVAALTGLYFFEGKDAEMGAVTLLASGGILYLVVQDVAPQAKLKRHWAPALGAVFGFALGLVGKMLTA